MDSIYSCGLRGLNTSRVPRLPSSWPQWVFPAPIWDGRVPVISDGFQRGTKVDHREHLGTDITYHWREGDPTGLPQSTTKVKRDGTRYGFTVPNGIPALAAGNGTIWYATKSPRGFNVLIDHGLVDGVGVTTYYQHLVDPDLLPESLASWLPYQGRFPKGAPIVAGIPLGIIGGDTLPGAYPLVHLHFGMQLPRKGVTDSWVNPAPVMRHWQMVSLKPRQGGGWDTIGWLPPAGGGSSPKPLSIRDAGNESLSSVLIPLAIGLAGFFGGMVLFR